MLHTAWKIIFKNPYRGTLSFLWLFGYPLQLSCKLYLHLFYFISVSIIVLSLVHTKPRAVFVRQSTKFSQCFLRHQLKLVLVCFFSADSMLNRRRCLSFSRVIWSPWLAVQLANQYMRKAQNGHAIWLSGVEYQLGVSGQLWTQTQTVAVNYLQKKSLMIAS